MSGWVVGDDRKCFDSPIKKKTLLYIERDNDQSQEIVRFARLYATFFLFVLIGS